jgi:hypothetical protein
MLLEVDDSGGTRPDAFWDDAAATLYVLNSKNSGSFVNTYIYNPATDAYSLDVDNVKVDGVDNIANRATIYRTPNGYLWTSMMTDSNPDGLWINRSTDGGRTWDGPVRLLVPNENGQTGMTHFDHNGTTHLAVVGAEDGAAADSQFRFLFIDQDSAGWNTAGAWTDESSLLPAFQGDEHSDDEVSIISDSSGNIYFAAETEGEAGSASNGDPQLLLMHRTPAGIWTQVTMRRHGDSTESRKRPTVSIDATSNLLYVCSVNQSRTEIACKAAPLNSLALLETATPTVVFSETGTSFRNNITPRFAVTSTQGLLVLVDDLTNDVIWQHRLSTG